MGSWNGTCAVSGLHVRSDQDVTVFMLLENKEKGSFCYGNALYDLCPIPFYGKYNDYGSVDECNGFGLNLVVNAIKAKLYEFGEGGNSCHDIPVRRNDFDIELLFEADHEDRLGIQHLRHWDKDKYSLSKLVEQQSEPDGLNESQQFELDRLSAKIMQVDTFRCVTHVIIHGDIFKDIMEKYYISEYMGEGKGNIGYSNSYKHIYFKDLLDSVTEYIANEKVIYTPVKGESKLEEWSRRELRGETARRSENLATRWLSYFRDSNGGYGLIDVQDYIKEYAKNGQWEELEKFVKEALTGAWVNSFMLSIRRLWSKQGGMGSQSQDHEGYQVLTKAIENALRIEKEYFNDDEDDSGIGDECFDSIVGELHLDEEING